jgi:rsbT co-antagonist protein RsbR
MTIHDDEEHRSLQEQVAALKQRVTELEAEVIAVAGERDRLQYVLNSVPYGVLWKTADLVIAGYNAATMYATGIQSLTELVGKTDFEAPWASDAVNCRAEDSTVIEGRAETVQWEKPYDSPTTGQTMWTRMLKLPLRDLSGQIVGAVQIFEDVTAQRQASDERERLHNEIIRMQAERLNELSTPLIPIREDLVVMPLIGSVDASRAEEVLQTLLYGISKTGARTAILDITGVKVVNMQVADTLVRSAKAVGLLGARVILTGIRPEVARILVELGADLTGIVTRGSLQNGIEYAMR